VREEVRAESELRDCCLPRVAVSVEGFDDERGKCS
jgi:hypothetical protein